MPLPQNINSIVGVGVLGVICVATVFVFEHYCQERRRRRMVQQIQRLDTEIAGLRGEFNQFVTKQAQRLKVRKRRNSRGLNDTTTDDYASALDNSDGSDLDFYDVSTDEEGTKTPRQQRSLLEILAEIDEKTETNTNLTNLLSNLQYLHEDYPEKPEILWRIAKIHYKRIENMVDKKEICKTIETAIEMCQNGIKLTPELYECHKWLAILIGARCDYQPIKEKIQDGQLFKRHVERAIQITEQTGTCDSSLYYMLGRFIYEYANLKWYEKKAATLICASNGIGMPDANFNIALAMFEKAANLNSATPWKENHLMMAKCKIGLNDIDGAVQQLTLANSVRNNNGGDDKVDMEIKGLLQKYA